MAEWECRERKAGTPWRGPGIVRHAGHTEGDLGASIVRLEVDIRDRPVVGHPVQRVDAEVTLMETEGVAFPVQRASADASHPTALEVVAQAPATRADILSRESTPPRILVPQVAPDILPTLREIVPRSGFEDDNTNAASAQLEGHNAAGRAPADDADVGVHVLFPTVQGACSASGRRTGLERFRTRRVPSPSETRSIRRSGPAPRADVLHWRCSHRLECAPG